jgi:hypothetical protein
VSSFADFTLVFDVMVIVLLVITIVYAVILNQRLEAFRDAKDEIQAVVTEFGGALAQAEQGMATLREAADVGGDALQNAVERAARLADDLAFLKDKGDATADRLEDLVTRSRSINAERYGAEEEAPPKLSALSFASAIGGAGPARGVVASRLRQTGKNRKPLKGLEGLR